VILYPAIDLKGGRCVRLRRGDMKAATVFNADPAAQAREFAAAGAEWIHVVDLDGAFAGQPVNEPAVEAILAAIPIPCQLGGGVRDRATIDRWLGRGVSRVVLGTLALKEPALVKRVCRRHPDRIAVGLDARNGRIAVEGWARTAEVTALELGLRFEDAGVAAIIYTDIDRDGVLEGPNVAATAELARALSTPVIASGGVSSLDDLRALAATGVIAGAIIGRALYEGRIDLAEAIALIQSTTPAQEPA
jgi:phosphoribosylformimino-5-aminoimidazole carboxamide ribotide isomerase